jgi:hypothetical protein
MAETTFDALWQKIMAILKPGMSIRNWTPLKGYLGDEMKVVEVSTDKVVIDAPKAKNDVSIYLADFQDVQQVWPAYKAGKVGRREVCDMTFKSKYIISILHWLESKGELL